MKTYMIYHGNVSTKVVAQGIHTAIDKFLTEYPCEKIKMIVNDSEMEIHHYSAIEHIVKQCKLSKHLNFNQYNIL